MAGTAAPRPVLRASWVRRGAIAVIVVSIVGMIIGSAASNNGTAVTFGLISAAAVLVLLVVSAVAPSRTRGAPLDDELAAAIEDRIQSLVAGGADEKAVRALTRDAVTLGRTFDASERG